jgi:hypothetical protein
MLEKYTVKWCPSRTFLFGFALGRDLGKPVCVGTELLWDAHD